MLHISGSKTDWLNQGCVRSHTTVSFGAANADICVVRALTDIFVRYPAKFTKNRDSIFATWQNGGAIRPSYMTAILRSTVKKYGQNPAEFPPRSLRSGGATAIYRETKDIDLAARFGRCEANSISAYLWESHQMMAGLSDHMVMGGHMLHTATRGAGRNEMQNRPKGTSEQLKGSLARGAESDDYYR